MKYSARAVGARQGAVMAVSRGVAAMVAAAVRMAVVAKVAARMAVRMALAARAMVATLFQQQTLMPWVLAASNAAAARVVEDQCTAW